MIRELPMLRRTISALLVGSSAFLAPALVGAQGQDRFDAVDEPAAELSEGRDEGPSQLREVSPNWTSVFADSFNLLTLQHAGRIAFQDWTREELGGPFFADWKRSLRMPDTWGDGDHWSVNYLGHSLQGAASGFIWLDNEDGFHDPELGFSKAYWASRGRATMWATAYSLQFEFGPLSEASIGNVGLRPEKTGWVDHVVTPAGGLALMVAEDALDRYVIARIENRTSNGFLRGLARVALNPSRSLSAVAQGRAPWDRTRPRGGR